MLGHWFVCSKRPRTLYGQWSESNKAKFAIFYKTLCTFTQGLHLMVLSFIYVVLTPLTD